MRDSYSDGSPGTPVSAAPRIGTESTGRRGFAADGSRAPDTVERSTPFTAEDGVAPGSTVETFAAVRLRVDSWRWAGVPFLIRAGKRLPTTATEVLVELRRPPQTFGEPHRGDSNALRFALGPDVALALRARA